ncbi:MAG: hypothetical protein H0U62_00225 [Actinobacteria bacterium]|nr:hypothetical protein [Actinomycetota bacterium]
MARLRHLVVVIPGIGGSVLETVGGSPVWGQGLSGLVKPLVDPARMSLAENKTLRPTCLLPSTHILPWKTVPGYDGLVRQLINTFKLGNGDVDIARDGPPRKPGAGVVLFPYDFRLSVAVAAGRLQREVDQRLAELSVDERHKHVIVVAHSMGGLVARFWLGPLGGARYCDLLLTLGTPHRGAPKALDWLLNGVRVGPGPVGALTSRLLSNATAVLREWSSTYELLPRYQAVRDEESGDLCYPHDLAAGDWFGKGAREAFGIHRRIEDEWPTPDSPDRPDVLALFARGHATPSRTVCTGGRVRVSKVDAEWQPNRGWRGDGTVPAISAYPIELSDEPRARRAVPERHGPMATTAAAVDVVREYEAESTASLRGDTPEGPWLGLDIDDVVAAGEPFPLATELLGADGVDGAAAWVTVRQDRPGVEAMSQPQPMTGAGGRWETTMPGLAPGSYRVMVEVVDVPRCDRVTGHEVVGVIEP